MDRREHRLERSPVDQLPDPRQLVPRSPGTLRNRQIPQTKLTDALACHEPLHACLGHRESRFATRAKRSEEHTSELQSLMRISYAVYCLKKKNTMKQSKGKK